MKQPREVRTRCYPMSGKPVATVLLVPHKQGRKSLILDYGLAEVNASQEFLRGNGLKTEESKALENICRQVLNGWLRTT